MSFDRPAYMREYTNNLRATRRAVAIAYLGGVCVKCGSTDHLEFHHRDPDDKVDRIAKLWTASSAKLWDELDKCVLLCRGCHFQVTYYGYEISESA